MAMATPSTSRLAEQFVDLFDEQRGAALCGLLTFLRLLDGTDTTTYLEECAEGRGR